ncbi:MAG: hypothetical protein JW795_03160 [Chitinivibrionales bacterium]|nr:hypothetical protein [Chitinivibrionales bacterium]
MVDYDSIIPPGQVGKLLQVIKMSALHDGEFTKTVKVISNAKNEETLRLSLSGKILSVINVSDRFLHMTPSKGSVAQSISLSTQKKDLAIKSVKFTTLPPPGAQKWQAEIPIVVEYKLTPKDSIPDKYGYYDFFLTMTFATDPAQAVSGDFIITTNHEKMAEITIRGLIVPDETKNKKN